MQPSVSLVKSISYPTRSFKSAACEYGCKHESDARKEYEYVMKQQHQLFIVKESGLILDPLYPFLGASPDGIVTCTCCSTGVLEIKCPYSCRNKGLKEVSEEKSRFFLLVTEAGNLELKDNHQYFYQIQLQMKLCNASFCDFVVWSKDQGILVQRVFPDTEFINRALEQVENFIKRGILPELVSNWYTKSRVSSGGTENVRSCSGMSVSVSSCCATSVPLCFTTALSSGISVSVSSCAATTTPSSMPISMPSCAATTTPSCTITVSSNSNMSVFVSSYATTTPSCTTTSYSTVTTSSAMSLSMSITTPSCANKTWCYCGRDESYDEMIACEYPGCEIEWFHYSCMGLTEDLIPDGDWFCPDCQALGLNAKKCKM